MSAEATAWAKEQIARRTLIPSVERTLLTLAKAHLKTGGPVKMTYEQISAQTRDDRRTVIRCIKSLINEGLLLKEGGRKKQRQDANCYTLLRVSSRHSENRFSGCQNETSETSVTVSPSENFQGDTVTPPNARARAGLGATEAAITLEELEQFAWPRLRIVGGSDV